MNDDRFIEEIVTKFLLSTCRLRPQLTIHAVLALVVCVEATKLRLVKDVEAHLIPLTSGSVAVIECILTTTLVDDAYRNSAYIRKCC